MEAQTKGRPPWANQVTELTLEEADALFAMGHKVYCDASSQGHYYWGPAPAADWYPPEGQVLPSIMVALHPRITYFFYIPKEVDDG